MSDDEAVTDGRLIEDARWILSQVMSATEKPRLLAATERWLRDYAAFRRTEHSAPAVEERIANET